MKSANWHCYMQQIEGLHCQQAAVCNILKVYTATCNSLKVYAAACNRLEVCAVGLPKSNHGHQQQLQLLQQCHQWVLAAKHPPASG